MPTFAAKYAQKIRCTAHSRSGEPCGNWAVTGRNVCRFHGGLSPTGVAAGRYKDGRYSRYLPERLFETYKAAAEDPQLLSLRDDIALLDSRIGEMLQKIDTGESGEMWRKAKDLYQQVQAAIRDEDVGAIESAIEAMADVFESGGTQIELWHDIQALLDQRRKTAESEVKRMVNLQQMIPAERAMALFGAMVSVVQKYVSDPDTLQRISNEFGALVNLRSNQAALTGGRGKRG